MNSCKIYAIIPQTRSLGPYLRCAIWFQGCKRHCNGCMTPDARSINDGKLMSVGEIADAIIKNTHIEGLTISGGEPFLQASALNNLLKTIKSKRDLGVIIYTGYTLDELMDFSFSKIKSEIYEIIKQTDILIDGPYVKSLNDGFSLRGSSNQKIHLLTDRYKKKFDEYYKSNKRGVELHMLDDILFLAGIPGKEMLKQWREKFIKNR